MVRTQTENRLKSRSCFLSSVRPADFHPNVSRYNEWQYRIKTKTYSCSTNLTECLARGHTSQWTTWIFLNRLRTGVTCNKEQQRNGVIMMEILHATVMSHRRTPDICWNSRSLHIPGLWMTFYISTKEPKPCVEHWRTAV